MLEKLFNIVSKIDSEYSDIRYEKMSVTDIIFNGKDLSTIGTNSTDGYVIRVLKDGGFATISVTRSDDLERAIGIAANSASLLGKEIKRETALKIPPIIDDEVSLELNEDPRKISLNPRMACMTFLFPLYPSRKTRYRPPLFLYISCSD